MRGLFVVALLGALAVASATCPNLCSQHGTCGENDRCTCFSNWQGADCSERVCPYGLAWVDAPSGTNKAHWYAECSNKGVCDRVTGQCACHAGYEGKGCKRSSCPNDCSGHGTCYFIEQLTEVNGKMAVNYGNWKTGRNDKKWYDLWDKSKIQGCVCDPYYEGTDCSLRQCPRGDNVLTTGSRTSAGVTEAKDQGNTHQEILITQGLETGSHAMNGEITLTYTDLYGGVWETDPIMLNAKDTNNDVIAWADGSPDYVASRIKEELENLPNQVVESVSVVNIPCGLGLGASISTTSCTSGSPHTPTNAGMMCVGGGDGYEVHNSLNGGSYLGLSSDFTSSTDFGTDYLVTGSGLLSETTPATGAYAIRGQCLNFRVEFTSSHNAGAQELLQVNYKGCNYDGCAPQYTGIIDDDIDGTVAERLTVIVMDVTELVDSGTSNKLMHREKAICSEHGLCDTTTGLCNCFSGYFDEDCHQQTVLV